MQEDYAEIKKIIEISLSLGEANALAEEAMKKGRLISTFLTPRGLKKVYEFEGNTILIDGEDGEVIVIIRHKDNKAIYMGLHCKRGARIAEAMNKKV